MIPSELGVITVLFNPMKYRTRYKRYFEFKEHMKQSHVDLYTVECIFQSPLNSNLPKQNFEITKSNSPKDIQIIAPSILWMKENLINIAIQHLPNYIRYVAWIDADIEFQNLNWSHLTIKMLQSYPIVQLFKIAYFTGPAGKNQILRKDYSFGYSIRHRKPIDSNHSRWYAHPGYAWAIDRNLFQQIGGLLDFCIVGSGDLHFAYALLGRIHETYPSNLHHDYHQLAQQWGSRVAHFADGGNRVGYVNTKLFHRWHGTRESRSYVNRWSILIEHDFSPMKDLTKDKYNNIISLKNSFRRQLSGKTRIINMERDILYYFISRNEDQQNLSNISINYLNRSIFHDDFYHFPFESTNQRRYKPEYRSRKRRRREIFPPIVTVDINGTY